MLVPCSPKHTGTMVSPDKPGKVLVSIICQWNLFFSFSAEFCLVTLENLVTDLWFYLQKKKYSPLKLVVCGFLLSFCLSYVSALFAFVCVCVLWRWQCFGMILCWQPGQRIILVQVLRFVCRRGWQVDFRDFQEAEKETFLAFQHLEEPGCTSRFLLKEETLGINTVNFNFPF